MSKLAVAIIQDSVSGKMLMQHRGTDAPISPNKWGLFGGHIEEGETAGICIQRELEEEIGVRVDAKAFELLRAYVSENGNDRNVFLVKLPMTTKIVLGEGQGYEWISPDEIFSYDLTSPTKNDMEFFLKK